MGNTSIPPYIKMLAAGILGCTYVALLGYAGLYAATHGWDVNSLPSVVSYLLGAGMTLAISTLGIHTGASVTEQQQNQGQANQANQAAQTTTREAPQPQPQPAPVAVGATAPLGGSHDASTSTT